jgi:predicted nuclease of predicted toxin-antitoxin system
MQITFHLDENIHRAVADGLRRRGLSVTTPSEVGLEGVADEIQLEFATKHRCVMVTHDADYLRLHASGVPHAGIAYCHTKSRSVGEMVRLLAALAMREAAESMRDRIEFL